MLIINVLIFLVTICLRYQFFVMINDYSTSI